MAADPPSNSLDVFAVSLEEIILIHVYKGTKMISLAGLGPECELPTKGSRGGQVGGAPDFRPGGSGLTNKKQKN